MRRASSCSTSLAEYEDLTSQGYLDRLNAPTPWSTKMMPHHLGMIRSQCRVIESFGGGVATALATIRLSPQVGRETDLQANLTNMLGTLAQKPGLTGAHLLRTDTPTTSAPTTEQQIRGKDGAADWIALLSGYDADAIEEVVAGPFSPSSLHAAGAGEDILIGRYRLAFTMTAQDVAAG